MTQNENCLIHACIYCQGGLFPNISHCICKGFAKHYLQKVHILMWIFTVNTNEKEKVGFVHVNSFISFSLLANLPLDSFSFIAHLPPNQTLPILSPPLFASCNPPPLVSFFQLSHRRRTGIYVGSPAWSWWWLQSSSYAGRLSTSLSSSQPWSKSPAPHCWLLPGTSASPWATPTGSTWHYMGTKSPQNC